MQKKASWSIILQSIYLHDINPFASGRKPNNSGFLDSPAKQKYLAVRHPGRINDYLEGYNKLLGIDWKENKHKGLAS